MVPNQIHQIALRMQLPLSMTIDSIWWTSTIVCFSCKTSKSGNDQCSVWLSSRKWQTLKSVCKRWSKPSQLDLTWRTSSPLFPQLLLLNLSQKYLLSNLALLFQKWAVLCASSGQACSLFRPRTRLLSMADQWCPTSRCIYLTVLLQKMSRPYQWSTNSNKANSPLQFTSTCWSQAATKTWLKTDWVPS